MKHVNHFSKKAVLFTIEVIVILGLIFNNAAPIFAQAAPMPAQPNHALGGFTYAYFPRSESRVRPS